MFIINNKYRALKDFYVIITAYSSMSAGLVKGSRKCGLYCNIGIIRHLKGWRLFPFVQALELCNFFFVFCGCSRL